MKKTIFQQIETIALFDLSNIVGRAISVSPDNYLGLFSTMLLRYRKRFPNREFVFCIEGKGADRRREIYSGYKAERGSPDDFYACISLVEVLLEYVDCWIVKAPEGEADDAIASYREQSNADIIIISEDRDLWQLIDRKTKVLAHIRRAETLVDKHVCRREMGVEPEAVPLYKAVLGDKSDGIPRGIRRAKKADLLRLIQTAITISHWQTTVEADESLTDGWKSRMISSMESVTRNHKLTAAWKNLTLEKRRGIANPEQYRYYQKLFGAKDLSFLNAEIITGETQ